MVIVLDRVRRFIISLSCFVSLSAYCLVDNCAADRANRVITNTMVPTHQLDKNIYNDADKKIYKKNHKKRYLGRY